MTQIYLAVCDHDIMLATFSEWDWVACPVNFLVAFPSLSRWNKCKQILNPKATILDSGAFSAWTTGKKISYEEYSNEALSPQWNEVAALDIIGDPHGSILNAMMMKNSGYVNAFPTFHYGEPWEVLAFYKNEFSRVGLGGLAGAGSFAKRFKWVAQCFARAYPCKFHGFGVNREDLLMEFPFFSADTSSWFSVVRFGNQTTRKASSALPGISIPRVSDVGTQAYNINHEVKHQLEKQDRLSDRWKVEFSKNLSL